MTSLKAEIPKNKIRLHYLDGIRGVAAFLVIFYHFRRAFFEESQNSVFSAFSWKILDLFFLSAEFSVQTFFVLSGFVLAYNSFNRKNFLKKQWIKRYYRLFVPVFLSSLLYYFFIKGNLFWFDELSHIHSNDWIRLHWNMEFTFPKFLFRFVYSFLLFSDWQFIWNINSSLWTIPIELYWSYILFVCFVVVRTIKNKFFKNVFLAVTVLSIIRFMEMVGEAYAVLFLGGALLALNFDAIRKFFGQRYKKLLLLLVALVYIFIVQEGWLKENYSYPFKWSFFAAIMLIMLAMVSTTIQKFFSGSFIQWLGRISFSLYLLHLLVIGSLGAWLYVEVPYFRADLGLFLLLCCTVIVSLGLAHLFTKYIDEPLMNIFDVQYKKFRSLRWKTFIPREQGNK